MLSTPTSFLLTTIYILHVDYNRIHSEIIYNQSRVPSSQVSTQSPSSAEHV